MELSTKTIYSAEIQAMAQAIREREADYNIWQDLPTTEEVEEQQRFMRVLEKRDYARQNTPKQPVMRVVSASHWQD